MAGIGDGAECVHVVHSHAWSYISLFLVHRFDADGLFDNDFPAVDDIQALGQSADVPACLASVDGVDACLYPALRGQRLNIRSGIIQAEADASGSGCGGINEAGAERSHEGIGVDYAIPVADAQPLLARGVEGIDIVSQGMVVHSGHESIGSRGGIVRVWLKIIGGIGDG